MVLTKSELIAALQNEVRILFHLAGKIDRAQLDYRPAAKQRPALELLKYLSVMGPQLPLAATTGGFDRDAYMAANAEATARDFDQTLAAIATQHDQFATLLGGMSDEDFRADMPTFDGSKSSKGAFIVNTVLGGYAAYRTQLFCYLKSCGQDTLNTGNLWRGVDPAPAS